MKNPQAVRVAFRQESLGLYGQSLPTQAKKNPQAEAWGYTDEARLRGLRKTLFTRDVALPRHAVLAALPPVAWVKP